jgi:hypothetical protein
MRLKKTEHTSEKQNNEQGILITKMSGDQVYFDEEKLKKSLRRSKADEDIIAQVIEKVKKELYDSMPTKEIYRLAFSHLRKYSATSASRYKLKSAILELGPSGFPFEKYVAELCFRNCFSKWRKNTERKRYHLGIFFCTSISINN